MIPFTLREPDGSTPAGNQIAGFGPAAIGGKLMHSTVRDRGSRLFAGLALSLLVFGGLASMPAIAQSSGGTSSGEERRIVTVDDADYFGADFRTLKDVDLEACKAACLDSNQCRAFTFNTSAGWCFLKSDVGRLQAFSGAVAGRVVTVAVRDEATRKARESEISFLPGSLTEEAGRYGRALSRKFDAGGATAGALESAAWTSLGASRYEDAERSFARALTLDGGRFGLWSGLASSLVAQKPSDWQRRNQVENDGASAAINAYLASTGEAERVDALDLLASALERRQLYKPAIKALRAGLELDETPLRRTRYDKMVAQHGFRILDHQVDADAATPRICIVFSDTLARATDFSPFVRVTGEGPYSIESEGAQICVDGVRHGERYSLLLREGVPSADGEKLEKTADLTVYVRDRSPSVRFLGRAYVLPAGDGATIPVITVNTASVETEIYRIGERGLAAALRDQRILSQLNNYRADQIRTEYGEKLWSGTVETQQRLNQDVTTAVPVADFGLEMKPGVYAMVARAKEDRENRWGPWATQWFLVSDLGVSAYTGPGEAVVAVRSLSDASAVADASVRLVAVNNEVLGETKSDADGFARFAPGLTRGTGGSAPAMIGVETASGDYAFLDLTKPAFDLSDRGVEGRAAPGPIDVFAWLDRGVFRPGETVHAGAMARDPAAMALPDLPLTFIYDRPDGVEHARVQVGEAGAGGRAHALELPASAQQGSWSLRVHADPKSAALAQVSFLVEDYQPERVDFTPTADAEALDPQAPPTVSLEAKFLYGAPAGGQRVEGDLVVSPTRKNPAFPGYVFGLADEQVYPNRQSLPDGTVTDETGKADFVLPAPQLEPTTAGYEAKVVVRVVEAGGRYVERGLDLPVLADGPRIGVKPGFDGGLGEGGPANFEIVAIDRSGARMAANDVLWTLSKVETRYQWYRSDNRWSFEPVTTSKRVANGEIAIEAGQSAMLSVPVEWGRYRLELVMNGPEPAATSTTFSAGWYASASSSQTPDVLEVGLDKEAYRVGDTAKLRLKPRFDGIALVQVMGDRLIESRVVEVAEGESDIDLTVTDDWGNGAYVTATLLRPMDLEAKRMPSRALGLQWLAVDPGERRHSVVLDAPDTMRPRTTMEVGVQITGQPAGKPAFLTIAAVDVGILNLTRFKTPDPDGWYFGQRRLGMEIRDYYGELIDRTVGDRGLVRSGGDGTGLSLAAPPPQEAPMALFSGVVETDADGKATVSFEVPDFNGTVRLMAVAWSENGVGHAEREVVVRDPVVVTATLPRFLAPDDSSRLLVEIDNVEGPAGDYVLQAEIDGPLSLDLDDISGKVTLAAGERRSLRFPVTANGTPGNATLALTLAGPDGPVAEKSLALGIRDTMPPISRRSFVTLAPGAGLTLDADTLAGIVPQTASLTVAAGGAARIDIPGLLAALDRYPYGCTEQTTSRALPLLYLNELAVVSGLETDNAARERVETAIRRVLGNQNSSGSFGLWSSFGNQDPWLDAYVADFLIRARERDYDVPRIALESALDNLENRISYASDFDDGGEGIAYGLYVLATAGRASVGDLRYYADVRLSAFGSALAKAQVGAALSIYGETERAGRVFKAAVADVGRPETTGYRGDYGTALRDAAGVLAYVTRAGATSVDAMQLARDVANRQDAADYLSTQDMAWLLVAGHELQQKADDASFAVDGQVASGRLDRRLSGTGIAATPVRIENRGDKPADVVLTVAGRPVEPEPAGGNGYRITRAFYDLDGNELSAGTLGFNTRIAVVLTVTRERPGKGRMLVVDRLPAGLVIDNPRLVRSGDIGALDWLSTVDNPDHVEFRDDRFVAAVDETQRNADVLTFAYLARAALPGSFVHPPATVEDMYRPDLSARTATGRIEVLGPLR